MLKQELARAIGDFLGVPPRDNWFSGGSKVTADFQRDIGPVLGISEYGPDKVQHMRAILEAVAVPWSTVLHSSDGADNPGGNVTRDAYADLLAALQSQKFEEASEAQGQPLPATSHAEHVQRSIRLRRGQAKFRSLLMDAYDGTCAMTCSTARPVLEAAHIVPHSVGGRMHPSNGLLLRADLHTLFDLRLVTVDVEDWTVLVSPTLEQTDYWTLQGSRLSLPRSAAAMPDRLALRRHRSLSGLRDK